MAPRCSLIKCGRSSSQKCHFFVRFVGQPFFLHNLCIQCSQPFLCVHQFVDQLCPKCSSSQFLPIHPHFPCPFPFVHSFSAICPIPLFCLLDSFLPPKVANPIPFHRPFRPLQTFQEGRRVRPARWKECFDKSLRKR